MSNLDDAHAEFCRMLQQAGIDSAEVVHAISKMLDRLIEQANSHIEERLAAKEWHLKDCLCENSSLWEFLKSKNLSEEFLQFLEEKRR